MIYTIENPPFGAQKYGLAILVDGHMVDYCFETMPGQNGYASCYTLQCNFRTESAVFKTLQGFVRVIPGGDSTRAKPYPREFNLSTALVLAGVEPLLASKIQAAATWRFFVSWVGGDRTNYYDSAHRCIAQIFSKGAITREDFVQVHELMPGLIRYPKALRTKLPMKTSELIDYLDLDVPNA